MSVDHGGGFMLGPIARGIDGYWEQYAAENPTALSERIARDVHLLAGLVESGDRILASLIEAYTELSLDKRAQGWPDPWKTDAGHEGESAQEGGENDDNPT